MEGWLSPMEQVEFGSKSKNIKVSGKSRKESRCVVSFPFESSTAGVELGSQSDPLVLSYDF